MSGDGVLRRAFDFKPGDRLLQTGANLSLSPVQRQIVLGSVLGDGWFGTKLSQSGELVGVNVNFAHKEEHEEYLNWKAKILKPYICSIYGDNIITAEMRKIDEPWMFHLYEESKRGISHKRDYNLSPTLLRNIGPLGLAVWYMDDGRKIERKSSLIKMQSYTPEDAESIIDNINARFRTDLVFKTWKDKGSRKNGEGWGASVGEEFRKLVAPCMEKSMLSRLLLPNERKLWKPKLKDDHEQSLHTIEVEIEDITEETYSGHKYDLEVQDNHFYVVDGAIVENSPEYEPCGDALKFYSDCRLRFNPRALSGVPYPVKGKGMVMEEPSVTVKKGKDQYRFIHVRATKNKLAMPYLETWIRLWIEDGNGDARGFDPVWDTFMYLDNTGQLSHKGMKKIVLKIKKHENAKPMEWLDFKTLIVGTKKQQKEVCERIGLKWFDLRAFTLEQLNKKDGMALFLEHKKSGGEREEDDDEEEGDDGDDAD